MSTLALVRYTETTPHVLTFDKTLKPPPADLRSETHSKSEVPMAA